MTTPDGQPSSRFDGLTPGEAHYLGPEELPAVHAMRNTGSTELVVLIVESYSSSPGGRKAGPNVLSRPQSRGSTHRARSG